MRRALLTGLLVGLALLSGYLLGERGAAPEQEPTAVQELEKPAAAVVLSVRSLSRLEGASFHMERIVDLTERQTRLRGLLQADDRLLLVAVGDVIAGVDLSRLVEADLTSSADGKRVQLTLPPAEIFSASLNEDKTYVHSRETDLLANRSDQLESRAREKATQSLRQAALEEGILAKAEAGVERTLTALLLGLGFQTVAIRFEAPRQTGRAN